MVSDKKNEKGNRYYNDIKIYISFKHSSNTESVALSHTSKTYTYTHVEKESHNFFKIKNK